MPFWRDINQSKTIWMSGILAIIFSLIFITVFFIIHNNSSIFDYHNDEQKKNL